jgi:hypothetical protein
MYANWTTLQVTHRSLAVPFQQGTLDVFDQLTHVVTQINVQLGSLTKASFLSMTGVLQGLSAAANININVNTLQSLMNFVINSDFDMFKNLVRFDFALKQNGFVGVQNFVFQTSVLIPKYTPVPDMNSLAARLFFDLVSTGGSSGFVNYKSDLLKYTTPASKSIFLNVSNSVGWTTNGFQYSHIVSDLYNNDFMTVNSILIGPFGAQQYICPCGQIKDTTVNFLCLPCDNEPSVGLVVNTTQLLCTSNSMTSCWSWSHTGLMNLLQTLPNPRPMTPIEFVAIMHTAFRSGQNWQMPNYMKMTSVSCVSLDAFGSQNVACTDGQYSPNDIIPAAKKFWTSFVQYGIKSLPWPINSRVLFPNALFDFDKVANPLNTIAAANQILAYNAYTLPFQFGNNDPICAALYSEDTPQSFDWSVIQPCSQAFNALYTTCNSQTGFSMLCYAYALTGGTTTFPTSPALLTVTTEDIAYILQPDVVTAIGGVVPIAAAIGKPAVAAYFNNDELLTDAGFTQSVVLLSNLVTASLCTLPYSTFYQAGSLVLSSKCPINTLSLMRAYQAGACSVLDCSQTPNAYECTPKASAPCCDLSCTLHVANGVVTDSNGYACYVPPSPANSFSVVDASLSVSSIPASVIAHQLALATSLELQAITAASTVTPITLNMTRDQLIAELNSEQKALQEDIKSEVAAAVTKLENELQALYDKIEAQFSAPIPTSQPQPGCVGSVVATSLQWLIPGIVQEWCQIMNTGLMVLLAILFVWLLSWCLPLTCRCCKMCCKKVVTDTEQKARREQASSMQATLPVAILTGKTTVVDNPVVVDVVPTKRTTSQSPVKNLKVPAKIRQLQMWKNPYTKS